MRGSSIALRAASLILFVVASLNVLQAASAGRPLGPFVSFSVVLGLAGAGAWWVAGRYDPGSLGVPLTPFWRTVCRVVGALLLLFGSVDLLLVPVIGWRAAIEGMLPFAVPATVLLLLSFLGRSRALDVSLLTPRGRFPPAPPASDATRTAELLGEERLELLVPAAVGNAVAAFEQASGRMRVVTRLMAVLAIFPFGFTVALGVWTGRPELWVWADLAFLPAVWVVIASVYRWRYRQIAESLASGRLPSEGGLDPPIVVLARALLGRPPAAPGPLTDDPRELSQAVAAVRFGRRMTKESRAAGLALTLIVLLLGGAAAWAATFAATVTWGGGTGNIARDAGLAWLDGLLVALGAFRLLHRAYLATDQLDLRFGDLERELIRTENEFWTRY